MVARPFQLQPSSRSRRDRKERDTDPVPPRRWRMVDVSDVVDRPTQRSRGRFEGY